MRRGAVFDETGSYRYHLWRRWSPGRGVTFVMLNPSFADGACDDPTIRSCIRIARSAGFGRLDVVNLFAYRTPDPRELTGVDDPIGPKNNAFLRKTVRSGGLVVAAWGVHGSLLSRERDVLRSGGVLGGVSLRCLGVTKGGHPRHPLYTRTETPFRMFTRTPRVPTRPSPARTRCRAG